MKSKKKWLSWTAVGLFAISGAASAAPIVNGDFESGSFAGWTTSGLTCSGVGSNYSTASGGCYGYDADPHPFAGNNAAYLGTAAGGGIISQLIDTIAGTQLRTRFLSRQRKLSRCIGTELASSNRRRCHAAISRQCVCTGVYALQPQLRRVFGKRAVVVRSRQQAFVFHPRQRIGSTGSGTRYVEPVGLWSSGARSVAASPRRLSGVRTQESPGRKLRAFSF